MNEKKFREKTVKIEGDDNHNLYRLNLTAEYEIRTFGIPAQTGAAVLIYQEIKPSHQFGIYGVTTFPIGEEVFLCRAFLEVPSSEMGWGWSVEERLQITKDFKQDIALLLLEGVAKVEDLWI